MHVRDSGRVARSIWRHKIAVVTGSRAEFGLLAPLMKEVAANRWLNLATIVTGAHMVSGTWQDVVDAGFRIHHRVPMQRRGQRGRLADVAAVGRGVSGLGPVFERVKPDLVLVLGDRIEALAAACAAQVGGFRLAHVHGGDRAVGVADESIRHAISKMAHLHFPATAKSRARLIRMGENPCQIHRVGSTAVDDLPAIKPAYDPPHLIVAQHPIGASNTRERMWMHQTLRAVASIVRDAPPRTWILVVNPNSDPGADGIQEAIDYHLRSSTARSIVSRWVCRHHPRLQFLPLLAGAKAIVGNSSAGLIESTVLGVPCVNVGPRQDGRERLANVIDCDYGTRCVRVAIERAVSGPRPSRRHPYGDGRAGQRIADHLATVDLRLVPLQKRNRY